MFLESSSNKVGSLWDKDEDSREQGRQKIRKVTKKKGHGRKRVAGRRVKYRRKEKKWEWTVKTQRKNKKGQEENGNEIKEKHQRNERVRGEKTRTVAERSGNTRKMEEG